MARLKEADFYYGAVLSTLVNNGICPILIEGGSDRQVYDFTTNNGDEFRLFVKYCSTGRKGSKEGYISWQFTFSGQDIAELSRYITANCDLSLGLVCGVERLCDSEYAVLQEEEINTLLTTGKKTITLSRMKGEHAFRLSLGGGREDAIKIRAKRLY